MSFARLGSSARKARPAVAMNTGSGRGVLHREPAPVAPARLSDGALPSPPAAAGADLVRDAAMITANPPRPSTVPAQIARPILIRTVSRAAIEDLVARLVAEGVVHIVTVERSSYAV